MFFLKRLNVGRAGCYAFISCVNNFNKCEFSNKLEVHSNSGELYLDYSNTYLLKFERCKYNLLKNPVKWVARDFFRKTFFINIDARREVGCYAHVNSVGIKTPKVYAWGVFLNPFSSLMSFIIIEYKKDFVSAREFLSGVDKSQQCEFIRELLGQMFMLNESGYIHRDCHLDNFLVSVNSGEILWIDIHLKKKKPSKRNDIGQLKESLKRIFDFDSDFEAIFFNILNERLQKNEP